jgi:plasmid replication initiation protein
MDKKKVLKSNSLIKASYRLNAQAQKLILACISKVDPRDEIPKEITITGAEYASVLSPHANVRRDLYRAADALFESSVIIKDGNEETELYWVQKKVKKIKGETAVTLTWSDDVLKYISKLHAGEYTSYFLKDVVKLESSHAIRLYELLMQWRNTSHHLMMTIDDFRFSMGIGGKYPQFATLNSMLIKPAVNEINECSDINLEYRTRKEGRKVVLLEFLFDFKNKNQMKLIDESKLA